MNERNPEGTWERYMALMDEHAALRARVQGLEDENVALRVALSDERVSKRRILRRALDLRRASLSEEVSR